MSHSHRHSQRHSNHHHQHHHSTPTRRFSFRAHSQDRRSGRHGGRGRSVGSGGEESLITGNGANVGEGGGGVAGGVGGGGVGGGRFPTRRAIPQQTLLLREHIWSEGQVGSDFDVWHPWTLHRVYKIRGDAFSLRDARTIRSASSGRALYRMKQLLLSPRAAMTVKRCATDEVVATVRRRGYAPLQMRGGGTVRVWRGRDDVGQPWLEMEGESFGRRFVIVDGVWGQQVALVKRLSFTPSFLILRRCTYVVRMNAQFDPALMAFLVVAIHDNYRD